MFRRRPARGECHLDDSLPFQQRPLRLLQHHVKHHPIGLLPRQRHCRVIDSEKAAGRGAPNELEDEDGTSTFSFRHLRDEEDAHYCSHDG